MSTICIIDVSVFMEIIAVPSKHKQHDEILKQLRQKIEVGDKLFLPVTSILETGSQIARIDDEAQRLKCAKVFSGQVEKALNGESPFQPIQSLQAIHLKRWLDDFPASALGECVWGGLSIIQDFQRMCERNQGWNVYIWSLDEQLRRCQKWLELAA